MNRLVESPANDNEKAHTMKQLVAALRLVIAQHHGANCSFGELEQQLMRAANEAVRLTLESELQQRANSLGAELWIGGLLYRRHLTGTVKYFSLCGELNVRRFTYRHLGERNGPTLVPIELVSGLVEGATPALAFSLAQGFAKAPIRSVEQDLRAACRLPPSRSTLDRMAKAIGRRVRASVESIEPVVRRAEEVASNAMAINLGLDRTTIPMEESEIDPAGKARKVVRYRMAYVGTVSLTDTNADPIWTRRYAEPSHQGPSGVIGRMMSDLRHCLASRADLHIGIVQDGAPELWTLMREAFRADPILVAKGWRETVDFYHLLEYLARVLVPLIPSERKRQELLVQWRSALERNDRAIYGIDRAIEKLSYKLAPFSRRMREFDKLSGMYLVYKKHFRYASLKRLGLHRGSGVTEGACKSLITMRAKRSGQRWRPDGIDAVLALRSLLDSDRLPAFWRIFETQYRSECRAA
jgi:hypothetical protein